MEPGGSGGTGEAKNSEAKATRRLKEPSLPDVELKRPPRQKIRDPTYAQNRPRHVRNHPHRTEGQRTRRLREAGETAGSRNSEA